MNQAFIGAGGALVCVVIGHILARWWQVRQWRRDQKLLEFRELVTALTTAMTDQQHFIASHTDLDGEIGKKDIESFKIAGRTIADRIFIRKVVKHLKVSETFFDAREDFSNNNDEHAFGRRMDDLIEAIVTEAEKV